jgi:hypothetical protein
MVTSMASKIAISSTLAILMTCTTEIVSPNKRKLCGYTSQVWTRVWLLSAPFVGATSVFGQLGMLPVYLLRRLQVKVSFILVPQTALSLLNILGSVITLFIDTPLSVQKPEKQQETKDFYPKEIQIPDVWLASYKEHKVPL